MKNTILEHVDRARAALGDSAEAGANEAELRFLRRAIAELADALVGVADHVRAHEGEDR